MAKLKEFDLVVIGGGSAGYAAARVATERGFKVAVVEGGPRLGGLCILRGCMPTKALLESSHRLHEIQRAREFGLKLTGVATADAAAVWKRKELLISDFAGYREGQLRKGKHTLLRGLARFTGPQELLLERVDESGVRTGRSERVKFRVCVVTTGSVVSDVPLEGLKRGDYLTSDEALELKKLPRTLAVLGGGVVAVEFAQHFSRLGVKVTLLQRSGRLLRGTDPEAAAVLEGVLRREGMKVFCDTKWLAAQRLKKGGASGGWNIRFEHSGKKCSVQAEQILYALGRVPSTKFLALEAAGVQVAESGAVKVNAQMQSSNSRIFAAGDVTGLLEVVHVAIQQAEVAARNGCDLLEALDVVEAFRAVAPERMKGVKVERAVKLERWDARLKIQVIYTEPQIAQVGATAEELIAEGKPFLTASHPYADHGKSMIHGSMDGFVKLYCEPVKGEILGASFCGPHAAELIHEMCAVMFYRGTVADLVAMPHYHPTLAEMITYPAEELAEAVKK